MNLAGQVRLPNTVLYSSGCDSSSPISSTLTTCDLPARILILDEIQQLREQVASRLGGAGVDPVFVPSSSLFQAGLDPSNFYNTTAGSGHINVNGNPWGFFSADLPGNLC